MYVGGENIQRFCKKNYLKQLDELYKAASPILYSDIQLFYHGHHYRNGASKGFMCSVWISFNANDIAVAFQVTRRDRKEIFRANYADLPGEIEAEEVAKVILADMITALEKLTAAP